MTLSLLATSYVVPGFSVGDFYTAAIAGICLVFIYMVLKPVISFFTMPVNIITLGLFGILLNGLIFFVLSKNISNFTIQTFYSAIIVSIVVTALNWFGDQILT